MANIIHYGFGTSYLKDWGINQALREVYQNFLDYGSFTEKVKKLRDGNVLVTLCNEWSPDNLDFLRIGNSIKKAGSIGKHGEGIKMAFMIFLRMGLNSRIFTPKHVVYPDTYEDPEIGECFCLKYNEHNNSHYNFMVQFELPKASFDAFKDNIVTENDIEFSNPSYGDIVKKEMGSIYSGGLFVAKLPNISRAYNIKPEHLELDRDRSVPRAFDVNWAASKILDSYEKWHFKDETYDDTQFITRVPEHISRNVKPVMVGNSVEFTYKDDDGEEKVIKNNSLKETLKKDSLFQSAIKRLKAFLAKQLGLYDLLVEFKEKHIHSHEAIQDFELILERVKGGGNAI